MNSNDTDKTALDLWRRLTDPESEIMVLMSVLEDVGDVPRFYPMVADLPDEAFSRPKHRRLWQAIKAVAATGESPTFMAVFNYLKTQGPEAVDAVGGAAGIAGLGDNVFRISDPTPAARALVEKMGLRLYWRRVRDLMTLIEESEELAVVREAALRILSETDSQAFKGGTLDPMEVTREAIRELEAEFAGDIVGIPSGLEALDEILRGGGWMRGQTVYIGARPSRGKTSLLLKFADTAAQAGKRVLFFSLEMPGREIQKRRLLAQARINVATVRRGLYSVDAAVAAISRAVGELVARPLFLTDNDEWNVTQIRAEAMREKTLRGLDLVVIDYLGYIEPPPGRTSIYEKTTMNSKALHFMSLALDVPVIAGVQLNRATEGGGGGKNAKARKPQLSDFRDSGSIEQDADIAIFIHQEGEANAIQSGPVELIVAKQRNGPTGTVDVNFIGEYATFTDLPTDSRAADDVDRAQEIGGNID